MQTRINIVHKEMKSITDYTMVTEAANGVYFVPIRGNYEMFGFIVRAKNAEEAFNLAKAAKKDAESYATRKDSTKFVQPELPDSGAFAISELKDKCSLVCWYSE